MSFLGMTTFSANGHAQLNQLCHVIQSDMWHILHSPVHIILFAFPFQHGIGIRDCLSSNRVQFPCDFLFLMWLLLQMLHSIIGLFIFRVLSFLYPVVEPSIVLCVKFILS